MLITRLDAEKAKKIHQSHPITYYENAQVAIAGKMAAPSGIGTIVVATGGTSDIPVAEEAALTAEILGSEVVARVSLDGENGVARTFDELFEGTKALPWEDWIPKDGEFPVKGYALNYKALAIKQFNNSEQLIAHIARRHHYTFFKKIVIAPVIALTMRI